ncbi:carboxypeptidase family protein [Chitinophaga skermanii]|uniref:Carboxypeptidase family protein n=1 Tax=Chitinophaga skermanii TaxID=331697 RepID=A0A327QY63_9BACT|nr:TonB-dependent receptor [Chitinophaga skermanii]RAJ08925.1 carboxypeptidase family protein [Chitinophaga skermanii]
MRRIALLTTCLLLMAFISHAQTAAIKGILKDSTDGNNLFGATVKLTTPQDAKFVRNALTSTTGSFEFTGLPLQRYTVSISYIGYKELVQTVNLTAAGANLNLRLAPNVTVLGGVVIKGQEPPTKMKGDTMQYNASAYKTNPDASGEDLVKKMPGITVENGQVTAHGEQVRKVLLDGKEYFGEDATLALRNLPAEVIDKIEIFNKLSDQAQFSGFDDGNGYKALNIVTRGGIKNSQFGKVYAGYGTDDLYSVGGNVNFFNGNRRIGLIGMSNNVNQQNFSSQDVLGITSGGGGGGGGRGGGGGGGRGGGGFGGGGNNFNVGQQSGISKTNSAGINFQDQWGKKLTVTGSYFFNNSNTNNDQYTNQVYKNDDPSLVRVYNEYAASHTENYNHRVNMRLEYKIDSANMLIFTPTISFQKNNAYSHTLGDMKYADSTLISLTDIESRNMNSGFNTSNNLLFRHAFKKRGRTVSVNLGFSANKRDGETYLPSFTTTNNFGHLVNDTTLRETYPITNGRTLSANISYTEPIGKNGQLQFSYNPSVNKNTADQKAYTIDSTHREKEFDPSLSNMYENTYTVQNGGVSFRKGNRDNMLAVGVNLQHSELEGDRTFPTQFNLSKSFTNVLPNLWWRKKISKYGNINVMYRASTNQPSINNLQDVLSYTNPLFVSTGNPELNQSYTNLVSTRYQYANTAKNITFMANIFVQNTSNNVTSRTYIAAEDSVLTPTFTLRKGGQLTKPINVDGYWSARSFFNLGLPLKFIKSNLNTNAGVSYTRSPGYVNDIFNISNTYAYNLGAVISSNVSEYIDFTVSYNGSYNQVKNNVKSLNNTTYYNSSASAHINLMSKNGWVLTNDLNNQYYSAISGGNSTSFWLWNVSAAKKFMKDQRAELRLSVFDLLNQNKSIARTTTELYVQDVRSTVLKQYFMLTFTYKIKNWGKASAQPQGDQRRFMGPPPGGFGPGGPGGMGGPGMM